MVSCDWPNPVMNCIRMNMIENEIVLMYMGSVIRYPVIVVLTSLVSIFIFFFIIFFFSYTLSIILSMSISIFQKSGREIVDKIRVNSSIIKIKIMISIVFILMIFLFSNSLIIKIFILFTDIQINSTFHL